MAIPDRPACVDTVEYIWLFRRRMSSRIGGGKSSRRLLLRKRSTPRALFIAKSTSSSLSLSLFLPREDLLLSSFRTDDFFVAHAPLVPRLPADSPLCHRRHRRRLLGGGGGAISNERAHFKRAQLCAEGGAIWGPAPLATALQPEQSPRARNI